MGSCFRGVGRLSRGYATSVVVSPGRHEPRTPLSLLKSETNPERVLEICLAADLSPHLYIDRLFLSAAVSNLSNSNNHIYVKTLIDELRSKRADYRGQWFGATAIALYGQAKMVNEAVDLFKKLHKRKRCGSVQCLNSLIFAFIFNKDYTGMKRVYLEFPKRYNVEPDTETFNRAIKGFGECGESKNFHLILAEMEQRLLNPNASTFTEILIGFYREENIDEVENVLRLMKEKYKTSPIGIYNVRIKSLCKINRSKEAKKLLDEMLEKNCKPDTSTYKELIRGFCVEGDLENSKNLFNNMLNRGLNTTGEVSSFLAHFLCQAGDLDGAIQICNQSIEKGVVLNFTTMEELVKGLLSKGRSEEANELYGKVKPKVSRNLRVWKEIEASLSEA